MLELRDYQEDAITGLRSALSRAKDKRIVMQCPTGAGKTVMAAQLVRNARDKGKRVLFTVPAISLIDQTVEMFAKQGITDVGVIQAQHFLTDWDQPVQIASVQTLMRRPLPEADLVIIDEVHRWFKFYEKWFAKPEWQEVPFIGLSATPWTKVLGKYFSPELVRPVTTQELINRGRLSPFKVFSPTHPDLKGVRTIAGDYHEGDLSKRMNQKFLVADIVKTWKEKGEDRPTLCFAVDCAHARVIKELFEQAGVPSAYQDAETPDEERREIKREFHDGSVKVVVNVGTLTTGVDWDVRCIVLARPTKSEMLFVQIIGRGLRTAEGKDHCLILDHSDNHLRLGFVTDIDASHTELETGEPKDPSITGAKERIPRECPKCAFLMPARSRQCPDCGFICELVPKIKIKTKQGELTELKGKAKKLAETSTQDRAFFFAELKGYGLLKGYKDGWAANQYKAKFGVYPDWSISGVKPAAIISAATIGWIKSRAIAWAKARQKWRPW